MPSGTPGHSGWTDGHLEVRDESGKSLGHVRSTCNKYGQYGITNSDDERLIVSIDLQAAQSGAGEIQTKNGDDEKLPFIGGMTGYTNDCSCSDLKDKSQNYAYLGATVLTTPWGPSILGSNSFSLKTKITTTVQSSIFQYDPSTSIVTPQWINENGERPITYLGYYQDSLVLAGDKETFARNIGHDTIWVSLVFVAV